MSTPASQPIPAALAQLVDNGTLTTQQLGDVIFADNYIAQGLNALPVGGNTTDIWHQWLRPNNFRLSLDKAPQDIIYNHLTKNTFLAVQKKRIPWGFQPLALTAYPDGYTAPVMDAAGFNAVNVRLMASLKKSVVPAQQTATEQRKPIPDDLAQLVANGRLTNQQLGDAIAATNYLIGKLNAMSPGEVTYPVGSLWARFHPFTDNLSMNTLGIFKQHLSDEVFAVIQKGSIPEVMPTLTPMEYPEGYEAISVTDDDGYQQLMQRLAESVQKSVVPAQQPAAEQRQPIPAELKQLIENGRLSPDQLGDLILGYNFIVQEMHKLPPKENELERGPAEGLIWTDYDKLCDRLAVYSSIFDTTLVPHLVDPLLLVLQYNKPIPQPMEYPNTYSPPNLLDLNEFAAAMARYPRFPWEPAESSATPPSTQNVKVVEQAPALPKPLSEKGQRELATDFHERIVVELESMPGVGTLGKKDKSAIAVFIGTEGKGHSLTLTLPDAMKRDPSKQALCSAFREVVRKLQSHVYALGGLNPNQQDFLITEQRDWAPEPLWKPGAPAQAHTPSGDICPVKFRAKTAESLLNGLNEALSEGNRIAPETYSAHGMRAGDVVGGPGRP